MIVGVAALSIATSGIASANTVTSIYGHLHHDGTTTWFTTWRTHTHTNTTYISFLDQNGPNGDSTLWLGLRNTSNQQFTNTLSIEVGHIGGFTLYNTNNSDIPAIVFAINGRMGACGIFCDDDFGGLLDY